MTGHPKRLPETAWAVCFAENAPKKGEGITLDGAAAKRASTAYKNLSAEEREVHSLPSRTRKATDKCSA